MFSYEEIKELVKLVNENGIGEIDIKSANGDTITIKGGAKYVAPVVAPVAVAEAPKAVVAEPVKAEPAKTEKTFNSPIVGTFYGAAEPGAEPFAKVGKKVAKGDVICIIEAMKIMNEVTADFDGTIKEILVDNGDAVEYDQPLFVIE